MLSTLKLFDQESQSPVYALERFDDERFFSGGGDRIVACFKIQANPEPYAIVNTGSTIYSLKFLAEKEILLAGVMGGGIHVVDLKNKKEIKFLVNHTAGVFDLKYSPKHKRFFSAGGDGIVNCWSAEDFSLIGSVKLCEEKVRTIAIDNSGDYAAIGCGDGTICIFGIQNFEKILRIDAHQMSVNALFFHPHKNILISGGKDAHLKFWSTPDLQFIHSIPAHNYAIYSIDFFPDRGIFSSASRDKTIKFWDADNYKILKRLDFDNHHAHRFSVNKILCMNDILISASDDKHVIGWKIGN